MTGFGEIGPFPSFLSVMEVPAFHYLCQEVLQHHHFCLLIPLLIQYKCNLFHFINSRLIQLIFTIQQIQ